MLPASSEYELCWEHLCNVWRTVSVGRWREAPAPRVVVLAKGACTCVETSTARNRAVERHIEGPGPRTRRDTALLRVPVVC